MARQTHPFKAVRALGLAVRIHFSPLSLQELLSGFERVSTSLASVDSPLSLGLALSAARLRYYDGDGASRPLQLCRTTVPLATDIPVIHDICTTQARATQVHAVKRSSGAARASPPASPVLAQSPPSHERGRGTMGGHGRGGVPTPRQRRAASRPLRVRGGRLTSWPWQSSRRP